jgi:hypothetical protein
MEQNLKRFLLLVSFMLIFVLVTVLTTLGYMAPALRITFTTYQFFLIGACVGALTLATVGLIMKRDEWNNYIVYFVTVMASVFILAVINCVVFQILGGEHFVRSLVQVIWVFLKIV